MGCCNQSSVALSPAKPDPSQHVNYAKGMVLGVDDFTQEFAYLAGRDQWLARDAIGYGTLSGLAVTTEDAGADGPRLRVASGSALSPSGKLICVDGDQCALLNQWLAKSENATQVNALTTGMPAGTAAVSLYLTLCYADCQTAPVPIPGEPCRSEADLMANSRIADSFGLELRTAPPAQVEEQALRDFVQWLGQVQLVGGGSLPLSEADLLAALRAAAEPWFDAFSSSPPSPPLASLNDYMYGSPPLTLQIDPAQLPMLLRVALRFWVTELRPMWMACCCACAGSESTQDDCLLLACINVPVVLAGGVWFVDSTRPAELRVIEDDRPVLVHQRLLQEWLLGAGSAFAPPPPASAGMRGAFVRIGAALVLGADDYIVVADGGQVITLPACAADNTGRIYVVKAFNAAATLACTGTNRIDGTAPSLAINANKAVTVVSDGIGTWFQIANVV